MKEHVRIKIAGVILQEFMLSSVLCKLTYYLSESQKLVFEWLAYY